MAEKKIGAVTFYGGADTVTGANFMFEASGKRMLIDCGLEQGSKYAQEVNHEDFAYDPASVDILFVTHAHADHIGRIPKLVRDGFRGVIYSTTPTKELTEIMLEDSLRIIGYESKEYGIEPLYEQADVVRTMHLWKELPYHEPFKIAEDLSVTLKEAGHILGSVMFEFTYNGTKMVFTGDVGNSPAPLLRDTDTIDGATYLLMESVYGDRNHETRDERTLQLRETIKETVEKNGVLMVPAFSLERTQEILYELNDMVEHKQIPTVSIYVDSPLAIKATEVYHKSNKYFNTETNAIIRSGDDVFRFPRLHYTETRQESMDIWRTPGPKVIIAGSGMANGGRIVHHLKHYIGNKNNTVLFVGYQAVGTPGRQLIDGAKSIHLFGADVQVRAKIKNIRGYSAHKDSDGLIELVESGADTLRRVFVVMGEPRSSLFLAQRIRDYLGVNAVVPKSGERIELEF